MQLMVLSKNKKLGIDNKKADFKEFAEKLKEEAEETCEAIERFKSTGEDKEHIAEEALDTIQICIGILYKLFLEGMNIRKMILKHEKKLINRGWEFAKLIVFSTDWR